MSIESMKWTNNNYSITSRKNEITSTLKRNQHQHKFSHLRRKNSQESRPWLINSLSKSNKLQPLYLNPQLT